MQYYAQVRVHVLDLRASPKVLVPWEQNPKKIKWYAYKIHGNSV
jgi:hypothetical protein